MKFSLTDEDTQNLSMLASIGVGAGSLITRAGSGKIATAQSEYQAQVQAQAAAAQAARDAADAARTQKIVMYSVLAGVIAISGLGFMYVSSRRKKE